MNSYLDDEIETVFFMAQDKHQLISSRFVKEIAKLGGDVSQMVDPAVLAALKATQAAASGAASKGA